MTRGARRVVLTLVLIVGVAVALFAARPLEVESVRPPLTMGQAINGGYWVRVEVGTPSPPVLWFKTCEEALAFEMEWFEGVPLLDE